MRVIRQLATSSIGKKLGVALTGLLLCGFLLSHLAGNLLMAVGEEKFNHYAEVLTQNPLIIPAEIFLSLIFLIHMVLAVVTYIQNKQARPVAYAKEQIKGSQSLGSRTMIFTGFLLAVFLVYHVATFKYGEQSRGLFYLVVTSFKNKFYSLFYATAMVGLGLHLSHGFQSAFQTFGVNHPKLTPLIQWAGYALAVAVAAGFAALIGWAYFIAGATHVA